MSEWHKEIWILLLRFTFSSIKIVNRVHLFATIEVRATPLLRTCIQGSEGVKKQMLVDDSLGVFSVCISAMCCLRYLSLEAPQTEINARWVATIGTDLMWGYILYLIYLTIHKFTGELLILITNTNISCCRRPHVDSFMILS